MFSTMYLARCVKVLCGLSLVAGCLPEVLVDDDPPGAPTIAASGVDLDAVELTWLRPAWP